nr:uncharacterized protein LOC108057131 [Drosophila takahashii]
MAVKQLGGVNKPVEQVVHAASENHPKTLPLLLEESDFSFAAAKSCSLALQRGFYFSLRMPDWAKDFKEQTEKILAHRFEASRMNTKGSRDSKLSKYYGDHSSERYGGIFSERSTDNFFEIPSDQSKNNRPVRSPKIKDDLTCGKKVSS